jgi:hypothetical protein
VVTEAKLELFFMNSRDEEVEPGPFDHLDHHAIDREKTVDCLRRDTVRPYGVADSRRVRRDNCGVVCATLAR